MGTRVTILLHMEVFHGKYLFNDELVETLNDRLRQMSYSAPETPSNEFQLPQDEWGLATKLAIASISSQVDDPYTEYWGGLVIKDFPQGTMGGLLLGGLLFKTVGG